MRDYVMRGHNGIRVGCGHLGLLLTSRTWKWQVSQAEKVEGGGGGLAEEGGGLGGERGWIRWRGGIQSLARLRLT